MTLMWKTAIALAAELAAVLEPSPNHNPQKRCSFYDSCWPSEAQWGRFNQSIQGRLIASYPSADVCHYPRFDLQKCAIARSNWTNSFWRTDQAGAYSGILWETGDETCFIANGTEQDPCHRGKGTSLPNPCTLRHTPCSH